MKSLKFGAPDQVKRQKLLHNDGGPSVVKPDVISVARRSKKWVRRKRLARAQVLMMILKQQMNLNVDSSSEDSSGKTAGNGAVTPASERLNEFLSTGRTGRRNAVTNINQNANTGTADLPEKLQALTTESDLDQPGSSGMSSAGPSTSQ